jgi:hypothetical protein
MVKIIKRVKRDTSGSITGEEWEFEGELHEVPHILATAGYHPTGTGAAKSVSYDLSGQTNSGAHSAEAEGLPTIDQIALYIRNQDQATHSLADISNSFLHERIHAKENPGRFRKLVGRIDAARDKVLALNPGFRWAKQPSFLDGRRTYVYKLVLKAP